MTVTDGIKIVVAGSPETDTGQRTSTLVEQVNSLNNMNILSVFNNDLDEARIILKESNIQDKIETNDLSEFINFNSDLVSNRIRYRGCGRYYLSLFVR